MKKQINLIFNCYCGCGQISEEIKNHSYRLLKNQKWSAEGCQGDNEIVEDEFLNGKIIKINQF